MNNIAGRVKKIVAENLGVEADRFTETASFEDDFQADSLEMMELVIAFEEEFGCEIPDAAAQNIHTVKDVIDYTSQNAGQVLVVRPRRRNDVIGSHWGPLARARVIAAFGRPRCGRTGFR